MVKLTRVEYVMREVVGFEMPVPGGVDPATRQLLGREMAETYSERGALGLTLGSPVFQQQ